MPKQKINKYKNDPALFVKTFLNVNVSDYQQKLIDKIISSKSKINIIEISRGIGKVYAKTKKH